MKHLVVGAANSFKTQYLIDTSIYLIRDEKML